MDKLKKYLKDNEASMEMDAPDENNLWQRIEQGSTEKPAMRPRLVSILRYAAAACVILLAGTGLLLLLPNHKKPVVQPNIVKNNSSPANEAPHKTNKPITTETASTEKNDSHPVEHAQDTLHTQDEVNTIGQGYTHLIRTQLKNLRANTLYAKNPGYFSYFTQQLDQMDKDEAAVRRDIQVYGANDILLEQLINVYQQKLNLLKNLRTQINKMNNYLYHNNT